MKTRQIVCEENQRRLIVSASTEFALEKIRIDGDLIPENTTEKCDFAIKAYRHKETTQECAHTYILLELKGGDVEKAVSQLASSIKLLSTRKHYQGFAHKYAYAICSKVKMPGFDTFKQRQALLFHKQHGFRLDIRSREHTHQIKD